MVQVYREPLHRLHFASALSLASFVRIAGHIACVVLAAVIVRASGGMWSRQQLYFTQPEVHFTYDTLLTFQGPSPADTRVWTSCPDINGLLGPQLAAVTVSSGVTDRNADGKPDVIHFTAEVTGMPDVRGVSALLQFSYAIDTIVRMDMTALAHISHSSATPGASLTVDGDLALVQRAPLDAHRSRAAYAAPLFNCSSGNPGVARRPTDLRLDGIMAAYRTRNETTHLEHEYSNWAAGSGGNFLLDATIRIPPYQQVVYKPETIFEVKWFWIQWFSVFLALYLLYLAAESALFQGRLLPTRVVVPVTGVKHKPF